MSKTEHAPEATREPQAGPAVGAPVDQGVRPAFELWFSNGGKWPVAVQRNGDGYALGAAQVAWIAWQAAVAAERERCAAWVDARRDAFCEEHGSIDPDTGTLEFGRGAHAEAKSDYVGELEEIAAGLRALRA